MGKLVVAVVVAALIIIGIAVGLSGNNKPNKANNHPSGSNSSSTASNSNQKTAPGAVNIRDMMFTPSQITVQKGATVTWTNNTSLTHTVIDDLSNVGGPASGDIAPGATYSFTFNKTGSFQYHCSIHPSMRGTIVVQ